MLDKLERLERPEDVWQAAEKIAFRFAPAHRTGDIVLECKGLHAERGGRVLFDGVDLLVRRGERIGIVGPNGAGKTTLLKLLTARGLPADRGEVKRGTNLQEGYFDQHLGEVDPALTAVDNVRRARGDFTVEAARQYLARFRFYGDDTLRVVSGFSGGERSRLALAKLLLEPRNLLFLDEPTNHLDIPAAEILEEALAGFEGTVILVSHDRRFLENTTTRIVSVRDGGVDIYPGGFRDYVAAHASKKDETEGLEKARAKKERDRERDKERDKEKARKSEPPPAVDERARKAAFEAQRQAVRGQEKRKRRIGELETMIADGERQLETMRATLKEDPGGDWAKLAQLASQEQALAKRVDVLMVEWTKLSEERG
jgi:ATP-binding cassette subfamily F protein 3